MKPILLLLALIAASTLNATTSGKLAIDTQVPLVMDGKTIGSMTLKAGAEVTIVQVLPDNSVLISRGDSTDTFKVSKESLTPESLAMAAVAMATPTPTPVVAAPAPTNVSTVNAPDSTSKTRLSFPYFTQPSEVIDFLKTEGINTNMVKLVGIVIDPMAKIPITSTKTISMPSLTGNVQAIVFEATKGFEAMYSVTTGSGGFGDRANRLTPDSLAAAQEGLKKTFI